ncbi:energy transducer TonB [Hymenobacter sp. APR13]|uniref:energy transducer TonB n=1 Tax=Hymenobacter sp. APR13 TaxID=1356852 RepID=UPI0004E0A582|nr:energy transducer TonB [Hymenobacter sp. APR13]AII53741.1 hypothetical protein N008_17385 [Hymenobacter sp. APR13]
MKRILFALWLTSSSAAYAQQAPAGAQSLNAYFSAQPGNHSSAGFGSGYQLRTDTVAGPNGGGIIQRYYASGQKQEELPCQNLQKQELHGTQTRWFENGQVQAVDHFVNDQRHGQLLTYYPNGTLRRREEYEHGQSVKAECFGPDGQPVAFFNYIQFPEYAGGLSVLLQTIGSRTRYPKEAIRHDEHGKVLVDFVIDRNGTVQQARVRQHVSPLLDAEALRVVNSLRSWTPGRLDGEPVDVFFTLPVTFALR